MTNPPKPTGFGIMANGEMIGVISLEDVRQACAQYKSAQVSYDAHRNTTNTYLDLTEERLKESNGKS